MTKNINGVVMMDEETVRLAEIERFVIPTYEAAIKTLKKDLKAYKNGQIVMCGLGVVLGISIGQVVQVKKQHRKERLQKEADASNEQCNN